jgi:cobalt-zinc-cadmium efflux system membrane fusion protein
MSFRIAAAFGAVWLAVSSLAGPAWAHEGHDHDAPPPPVSKSIAPRGEAVSDAFELTAIPRDGKITLYLDRFRTNDPVRPRGRSWPRKRTRQPTSSPRPG